jgi:hypothetical protein
MSRLFIALYLVSVGFLLLASEQSRVIAREEVVSKLPPALLTRHMQHPGCIAPDDEIMPQEDNFFHARLDSETELYGILCETSAYNWPYAIYVVRSGYLDDAERVLFAEFDGDTGWTGSDRLMNAQFEAKTGLLKGFSKARGPGDCGAQSALKWDGDRFVLVEYRYKSTCDGTATEPFPLIYKRDMPGKVR